MMLLRGHVLRVEGLEGAISSKNDLPKLVFLSRNTKPTEGEARRALCRVLRDRDQKPSEFLLEEMARVFDPERPPGPPGLKAILKKRDRGHMDPYRDMAIGYAVFKLRLEEASYEDAIQQIAGAIGKSPEQVKKIYGKSLHEALPPETRPEAP